MKNLFVFASKFEKQFPEDLAMPGEVLITGIGKVNAAVSLSKKLSEQSFDRIINLGICGTINKEIELLTLFDIRKVIEGDAEKINGKNNEIELPIINNSNLKSEILITQDQIIRNAAQRKHVLSLGGQLVDMECYALAIAAKAYNIPLYAFKIVTDFADGEFLSSLKKTIFTSPKKLCKTVTELFL